MTGALKTALERRLVDLRLVLAGVDDSGWAEIRRQIEGARKIYCGGMGRSGVIMSAFANRLARAGFRVHGLFEASAPPVEAGDFTLIASGSGATATVLAVAGRIQGEGAKLGLFTANALSPMGRLADFRVVLPPLLPPRDPSAQKASEQVLASLQVLFEQALLIVLDTLADQIADSN